MPSAQDCHSYSINGSVQPQNAEWYDIRVIPSDNGMELESYYNIKFDYFDDAPDFDE